MEFMSVKLNNDGVYSLCRYPISFKSKYNKKIYNYKLDNSISRARNKVFDYVFNNDFKYFVTLTFSSAKYNVVEAKKIITDLVLYMRKKGFSNLEYILIPEYHKSGAIHFHGFFSSGFGEDFYLNNYGFLSWSSYDKFGFSSISKIRNKTASAKYITKYITKDLCNREKGSYLYFNSRGLKSSKKLATFVVSGILPIKFDFSNNFCDKVSFDNYYNFVTAIDLLNKYCKINSIVECNSDSLESLLS